MMNDKTAKLLLEEERYEGNANTPTIHKEYAYATQYTVVYGCGHR